MFWKTDTMVQTKAIKRIAHNDGNVLSVLSFGIHQPHVATDYHTVQHRSLNLELLDFTYEFLSRKATVPSPSAG